MNAIESRRRNAAKSPRSFAALMLFVIAAAAACGPNQRIMNSAATPSVSNAATTEQKSPFEQDLQAMVNADFSFIYVFRRKDGGMLDADDKAYLNAVMPAETNRRRLSDGEKAVIVGSNFEFPAEIMKPLTERFAFQDLSRPKPANTNTNTTPISPQPQ